MTILYESAYARLEVDARRGLVRFTRTEQPFAKVEDAVATFREVIHGARDLDRARLVLLSDLRAAPGRNDPEFERAITRMRSDLIEGFARRAALVRTVAGKLQLQRLEREDGGASHVEVFHDELDALRYLESGTLSRAHP